MGRVRVPWTSQPQQPTGIDPKWINRGLAYVYVGSKLIWSRETVIRPAITYGGGPKIRASQYGWATGFGATYGAGTTDSITGPLLTTGSARGGRSIVAHVYRNGAGGGGIGRIFDAGNSGAGAEFLHNTLTTNTLSYQCYVQSAVAFVSWSSSHVISSGVASVQGISIDLTATGKSASFYQNGAPTGVVAPAGATTGTYGTYTNALVVGNRTSDNARNWDGWIGSILIFDGPPLTGTEHALLAANPWQVFAPLERRIWVPSAGGTIYTITPSGGIVLAGSSSEIKTRLQSPSGGLVFSGAPALIKTRLQTASGTLTFGGTAPFSTAATYTISPSGGMTFAGTGNEVRQKTILPTGTLSFGGTLSEVLVRTQVPSGGITFSGTLITYRTKVFVPTGTITFSGTAPLINPAAPVAQGTWRTLTNAGI